MKKLVFFSGGTALGALAQFLSRYESPPVYIITTFDSGGSTQAIRRVFDMPAVGDLRNRLLAAASPPDCPPKIIAFLKSRLTAEQSFASAREELIAKIKKAALEEFEEWSQIRRDLETFIANMPGAFDARRASLGNLAITGHWCANGHILSSALDCYRELLHVKANIIPVCERSLHLGVRLENGQTFVGQHLLHEEQAAPVKEVFLTKASPWDATSSCTEICPAAEPEVIAAIRQADIVCFPMGSFYSSLLASLLPAGIGKAVALSGAIKVFIPNSGQDIETGSMDMAKAIEKLINLLRKDAPETDVTNLLNIVLLDSANGKYRIKDYKSFGRNLAKKGIDLQDMPIVGKDGKHEPGALLAALEGLF